MRQIRITVRRWDPLAPGWWGAAITWLLMWFGLGIRWSLLLLVGIIIGFAIGMYIRWLLR